MLAMAFVAVGGLFVMMNAEFLAVVQILIYVGAIAVLFIFAVMLTRDVQQGNTPNRLQIPAAVISALVLVAMIATAVTTDWTTLAAAGLEAKAQLAQTQAVGIPDAADLTAAGLTAAEVESVSSGGLADLLIGNFVLPFEAVSLLLLGAAIGGLALARGRGR